MGIIEACEEMLAVERKSSMKFLSLMLGPFVGSKMDVNSNLECTCL